MLMYILKENYIVYFLAHKEHAITISEKQVDNFINILKEKIIQNYPNTKYFEIEEFSEPGNIHANGKYYLCHYQEISTVLDSWYFIYNNSDEKRYRMLPQWMEEAYIELKKFEKTKYGKFSFFTINCSENFKQEIKETALNNDMSFAELVRHAIARYIKELNDDKS